MEEVLVRIKPYACHNNNVIEKVYSLPIDWKIHNLQKYIMTEYHFHCKYFHLQARDQLILKLSLFHDFKYLLYLSTIIPTTVPAAEQLQPSKSNISSSSSSSSSSRQEIVVLISNQELA